MNQSSRLLFSTIVSYFSSFNKSRSGSDELDVYCHTKEVLYLRSKTFLVTPIWQSHVWNTPLMEISVAPPFLLPINIALSCKQNFAPSRIYHTRKNVLKKKSNGIKTQLLLGYIKPHVEVKGSNVYRWLKKY